MNSSFRPWDRIQLTLLRFLGGALSFVDGVFCVDWGERLLGRMAGGWQAQLAELDKALASLERERHRLHLQSEALALHVAALYLARRSLAHGELRFDPADPRDEEILDASIDLLVKEHLAAIESEQVESGDYVYHMDPDWSAIRARLSSAASLAHPDMADWFRQGMEFIDDEFLAQTGDRSR
jgi:hypothetical protein